LPSFGSAMNSATLMRLGCGCATIRYPLEPLIAKRPGDVEL
jgi:hypothetical protein